MTSSESLASRVCSIEIEDNYNPITGLEVHNPLKIPSFDFALRSACTHPELATPTFAINIRYAKLAAKEIGKRTSLLKEDQIAAIHLYTQDSPFHAVLNNNLRDRDREKLKPFFPILRLLLSALYRLPRETLTLYRGVKKPLWEGFQEGDEKIWWTVTSCTSHLSVLSNEVFLGLSGARTLFAIDTRYAVDISAFSAIASEREYILCPGSHFKVISKLKTGEDCWMVQMKQEPYLMLLENWEGEIEEVEKAEKVERPKLNEITGRASSADIGRNPLRKVDNHLKSKTEQSLPVMLKGEELKIRVMFPSFYPVKYKVVHVDVGCDCKGLMKEVERKVFLDNYVFGFEGIYDKSQGKWIKEEDGMKQYKDSTDLIFKSRFEMEQNLFFVLKSYITKSTLKILWTGKNFQEAVKQLKLNSKSSIVGVYGMNEPIKPLVLSSSVFSNVEIMISETVKELSKETTWKLIKDVPDKLEAVCLNGVKKCHYWGLYGGSVPVWCSVCESMINITNNNVYMCCECETVAHGTCINCEVCLSMGSCVLYILKNIKNNIISNSKWKWYYDIEDNREVLNHYIRIFSILDHTVFSYRRLCSTNYFISNIDNYLSNLRDNFPDYHYYLEKNLNFTVLKMLFDDNIDYFEITNEDRKKLTDLINVNDSININISWTPKKITFHKATLIKILKPKPELKQIEFSYLNQSKQFLFKTGENLNEDSLVMRLFIIFNKIWEFHETCFQFTMLQRKVEAIINNVTYKIIPGKEVMKKEGFIEYIDSIPLNDLWNNNSLFFKPIDNLNDFDPQSLANRCASAIGSLISCCVLGIGERHQGNMLFTPDGRVFNIDFSNNFNTKSWIENYDFPIPSGFVDFLKFHELWEKFVERSWEALNVLRMYELEIYDLLHLYCFSNKHAEIAMRQIHKVFSVSQMSFNLKMQSGRFLKYQKI